MNEENIIHALNDYDGTQTSLEKTVSVLSTEMGSDWADQVFEKLGNLPVELKEKLDHVFNYYASLTAWHEAQSYLEQKEPLDMQLMSDRLPVLQHWLELFGQPGQDLYRQLEDRCQAQSNPSESSAPLPADDSGQNDPSEQAAFDDFSQEQQDMHKEDEQSDQEEVNSGSVPSVVSDEIPDANTADTVVLPDLDNDGISVSPDVSNNPDDALVSENEELANQEDTENIQSDEQKSDDNTPEAFAIHKAEREITLLDNLQSWLSARCLQLGDIETFAYPYYGMVVDLMRQVVKDIQAVIDLEKTDVVGQYYPNGWDSLIRKKEAIEADIQTAVENCESDTTALIEEGTDLNKVKKALGDLDTSTEKEYLGPAPDGFELLDDRPIDEEAVKEQYKQLEENAQKNTQKQDISVIDEKKTSQNEQNGVQRKLSFSLKPKKG